jgi:hypothetical protein
MEPHAIHLKAGDEITLQYLGAALVLQWHNLPEKTQQELVQQAESVGGLPPVTSLHDQIKALIGRAKSHAPGPQHVPLDSNAPTEIID